MLSVLCTNALFFEHAEEIFRLQECHGEELCLSFDLLFEEDLQEELLSRLILLQEVHHEHDHDLDRLLVELGQV